MMKKEEIEEVKIDFETCFLPVISKEYLLAWRAIGRLNRVLF